MPGAMEQAETRDAYLLLSEGAKMPDEPRSSGALSSPLGVRRECEGGLVTTQLDRGADIEPGISQKAFHC